MKVKTTHTRPAAGPAGGLCGAGRARALALLVAVAALAGACGMMSPNIEEITPGQLGMSRTQALVTVVDARDKSLYDEGRINNAIQVAPAEIMSGLASTPKDQLIVVYDAGTEGTAARDLARKIAESGYERVTVLKGGLAAWAAAGRHVMTREQLQDVEDIKKKFGLKARE